MPRKRIAVFFCFIMFVFSVLPVAVAKEEQPESVAEAQESTDYPQLTQSVTAPSYVVMELTTGDVALQKEAHQLFPPASLTKIMTALLVIEALESGTTSLDEMVTASENACSVGGVEIWLVPNEQMSVKDLLVAIMVGSGNDAAVALAEHIAGSEESFVAQMNRKAKQLGMNDTNFLDASGYNTNSQTSAYDVALMSRELLKHEQIKEYSTIWMYDLRGGETQLVNTNRLVRFYDGCTGLKTGVSETGRNCISASASKGDNSFVAVAMGIEQTEDSFEDAKTLLDYAFQNFVVITPEIDEEFMQPVKVNHGVYAQVETEIAGGEKVLIPNGRQGEIVVEADILPEIEAPVSVGQSVGTIRVSLNGALLQERSVVAAQEVPEMDFWNAFYIFLRKIVC